MAFIKTCKTKYIQTIQTLLRKKLTLLVTNVKFSEGQLKASKSMYLRATNS